MGLVVGGKGGILVLILSYDLSSHGVRSVVLEGNFPLIYVTMFASISF